jgi:hypothetical protein
VLVNLSGSGVSDNTSVAREMASAGITLSVVHALVFLLEILDTSTSVAQEDGEYGDHGAH